VQRVDVVVGIIFHESKFLAEKRKKSDKIDPGIVSLPGGHVELGETRKAALIREMKEELNIEVKKTRFIKKKSLGRKQRRKTKRLLLSHFRLRRQAGQKDGTKNIVDRRNRRA